MSVIGMTMLEIEHFESLMKRWGFGWMLENSDTFGRGKDELYRFLADMIGEEYDDYAFADEHADDYFTYLFDKDEEERYDRARAKALYRERMYGITALY